MICSSCKRVYNKNKNGLYCTGESLSGFYMAGPNGSPCSYMSLCDDCIRHLYAVFMSEDIWDPFEDFEGGPSGE